MCGLAGNGLTLTALARTPNLWTKSNRILASLSVSQFAFAGYLLARFVITFSIYVVRNPCDFVVLDTVSVSVSKVFSRLAMFHATFASVDRYLAIVHPFFYEENITDRVIDIVVGFTWMSGTAIGMSYAFRARDPDRVPCKSAPNIVPPLHTVEFLILYYAMSAGMIFVYARIFSVARRHHAAINTEMVFSSTSHSRSADTSTGHEQHQSQTTHQDASHDDKGKQQKQHFKAAYLTTAIVAAFIVMWFPYVLGRTMVLTHTSVSKAAILIQVSGPIGVLNGCCNWVLYVAVSKAYQRAFKKQLTDCLSFFRGTS